MGVLMRQYLSKNVSFFSEVWSLTHLHTLPIISKKTVKASLDLFHFQNMRKKRKTLADGVAF